MNWINRGLLSLLRRQKKMTRTSLKRRKVSLPEFYSQNWNRAEKDPELFISAYLSSDLENPQKPTSEQLRFMENMLSGRFDEGWFAGGNSSGKTWTAKFMAAHWA